jgi:hypothetical protein
LASLKRVVLSDKNHKQMKQEAIEILSILESMEDLLNHQRGIVKEEDFSQGLFEDKFLKELNLEM